jgi:hypothetical protein
MEGEPKMKKLYTAILVIVTLLAFSMTASADSEVESRARLDGSQEVPPVDTDMRGRIEVELEDGELEFRLEIENNTNDVFAAHLHCNSPGENGPVGVTLFMDSFTDEAGTLAEGTITAPDTDNACDWADIADVAEAIRSGNVYANVHTTAESGGVPSGEIRGNLPGGGGDDDDNDNDRDDNEDDDDNDNERNDNEDDDDNDNERNDNEDDNDND